MHRTYFLLYLGCCLFLTACDQTPKPEKTLLLAEEGLFSADISDSYALIGTVSGYAELWKIKGKSSLIHHWKHTDESPGIIAADISINEDYAITAEPNSIGWWRISDGVLLSIWALPQINRIKLSPDGQKALIGLSDSAVYLDLATGRAIYAFEHEDRVISLDISDNGLLAITGSEDQQAKLWDLTSGELKFSWPHENMISSVALSLDGKYALINAALSQTSLWKTKNGKLHKKLGPELITLSAAKFSKNNKLLLLGHTNQRIEMWKTKTGKISKFWRPKKTDNWRPTAATILAINFSANQKKFYSIAANGYLQKWKK